MTNVLVAVLLVLIVARSIPDLARLRDFSWLRTWLGRTSQNGSALIGVFLAIVVPVLLCLLVQWVFRGVLFGLSSLMLGVIALFYCWGPRDLERDVEAVEKAPDSERRLAALQVLRADSQTTGIAFEPQPVVEAVFTAALKRWFGVLFWFAVLGPAGALLYRLVQILAFDPELSRVQPSAQQVLCERIAAVLDFLPAHLMALSLALASNFDAVFKTWHDYHLAHGKGYFSFDLGFLAAIARASVDADIEAGDAYTQDAGSENGGACDIRGPLVALDDAMVLVRRVLVVWLTLIALIVLAGWLG